VWRAEVASSHYRHRGAFWNGGKHEMLLRYLQIAAVGILQATVAYLTNLLSDALIWNKYAAIYSLLEERRIGAAFAWFTSIQLFFAAFASLMVWLEPVSAGSGIPEVKCFLNGIDLPRVGAPKTLLAKVAGAVGSVAAGFPVGKERPMVHSGSVIAASVARSRTDRHRSDLVACGAAAGVCSAFSAPIGGILFSLEEGASYWGPSLTWRCFFCSMVALMTLYIWNTIGAFEQGESSKGNALNASQFLRDLWKNNLTMEAFLNLSPSTGSALGKVGFNKLFSFGNFAVEGDRSSYAVYELFLFILMGAFGGLIGAVFNHTNERITKWRMARINFSKKRRFSK
jgi:chloride channel 7